MRQPGAEHRGKMWHEGCSRKLDVAGLFPGGGAGRSEGDKAAAWESCPTASSRLPWLSLRCWHGPVTSGWPGVNHRQLPLGPHTGLYLLHKDGGQRTEKGCVKGCACPASPPSWPCLPQNNLPPSMMTRRNTYVCTERPGAERPSLLPNGKENRYGDGRDGAGGGSRAPWG